jgi:hypothetical protein
MAFSEYQKRMMVRKNSDLTKLSSQFGKDVNASTSAYEKAFGDYQKQSDELMAPYNTAVKNYQDVLYPQFEQATSNYKTQLEQFNNSLANFQPKSIVNAPFTLKADLQKGTAEQIWNIDGKSISTKNLPSGYSYEVAPKGTKNRFYDLYKDNPVPTFSDKAPSAPSRPEAPVIPPFDDTTFKKQSADLQSGFSRDLGSRKAARLNVIGRKSSRPLMGGM